VCLICLLVLTTIHGNVAQGQIGGGPPPTVDPGCRRDESGQLINCSEEEQSQRDGTASAGGSVQFASASTTKYVAYDMLSTGPDGAACVATGWRPEGTVTTNQAPSLVPEGGPTVGTEDNSNLYHTYPPCPNQQAPPQGAQEPPESYAARFWETVPLPIPKPYIAPGWAITGKLAYLETNGELRHTYTTTTPFGPLEIVATGRYYVDWGDGESSGPHSVEGKPWPNGEITHDYVWAKTYTIVVSERWTASWRLGGLSGTLRELRTSGQISDFAARQIQAVIR